MKLKLTFFLVLLYANLYPQSTEWLNITQSYFAYSIKEDGDILWIALNCGLVKFNKQSGEKTIYNHANAPIQNYGNGIIELDSYKNVWMIANGDSIVKLDTLGNWTRYNSGDWGFNATNKIKGITASSNGKICFCTTNLGFVIFDGTNWTKYDTSNSQLPSIKISDVKYDDQNNLWIITDTCLVKYDGVSWHNYYYPFGKFFTWNQSLLIDNNNNKWIVNYSQTISDSGRVLMKFDGTNWSCINDSIFFGSVWAADISNNNTIWLITSTWELYKFDGNSWINPGQYPWGPVFALFSDNNNNLWLAGERFSKYDGSTFTVYPQLVSSLITNMTQSLATYKNCIWTGHDQGINKFNGISWNLNLQYVSWPPSGNDEWVPGNVNEIAANDTDRIYVKSDLGILKYENNSWMPFPHPCQYINKMCFDRNSNLFFCGYDTLFKFDGVNWFEYDQSNTGINFQQINDITQDKNGIYWIGCASGLVRYDGFNWSLINPPNPYTNIISLASDQNCNIWLIGDHDYYTGNYPGYTFYYNSKVMEYSSNVFTVKDSSSYSFLNSYNDGTPAITQIIADTLNNVFYSVRNSGFKEINNFGIQVFNNANSGLPSDAISDMKIDTKQNLWLATMHGVGIYNKNGITFATPEIYHTNFPDNYILFPNPTSNILYIELNDDILTPDIKVEIFSSIGSKVFEKELYDHLNSIDIKSFRSGVYICRIINKKDNSFFGSKKFIVY